MKEGSLIVNNGVAAKGMSPGIAKGLNLNTPFYIGGVDKHRVALSPFAEVQHGFDGCIAHVSLDYLFFKYFKCHIFSSHFLFKTLFAFIPVKKKEQFR